METNLNFKSQICTTREQSERLIALGLRKETADMTHHYLHSTDSYELKDIEFSRIMHLQELVNKKPVLGKSGDDLYAKDIPAWSLHRLWELAYIKHIILDSQDEIPQIYNCMIDHIESQIKEGILDKKYLED